MRLRRHDWDFYSIFFMGCEVDANSFAASTNALDGLFARPVLNGKSNIFDSDKIMDAGKVFV